MKLASTVMKRLQVKAIQGEESSFVLKMSGLRKEVLMEKEVARTGMLSLFLCYHLTLPLGL